MNQPYPQQYYPPQPPAQQYPSQPPMQQPYAPPMPQGYPQQPYQQMPQVPAQQPPAQPLANGTLDDYFSQPSAGGGPSLSWKDKQVGHTYLGTVARDVMVSDVQQETNPQGVPQFFRDGRPKFVLKVPLIVPISAEHPEGIATWYVKGQARDELVRAMREANAAEDVPKAGAQLQITLIGRRPSRQAGFNPSNQVAVVYTLAGGSQPTAPTQAPAGAPQGTEAPSPASVPQPVPQQVQQYAPPAQAPQPVQQYVQQPVPQASAGAPLGAGLAMPEGLSPEQQQLFAQLAGAAAQQPVQQVGQQGA